MSDQTATIASLCVSTLQSLIVFAANFLTIAVFWIHRNKLRRTYLLLINLAVAHLLVGFSGTRICFDLAASSSNNKHGDVHLRSRRRLASRYFFGFINLAG